MVEANHGTITRLTGFPIFESFAKYDEPRGAARKIDGIPQLAAEAIHRLKPYEGGNETLWILHSLNNVDKHRLLLMIGVIPTGQTLSSREENALLAMYRYSHPGAPEPKWKDGIFALGPGSNRILKNGDHLLTVPAPDANKHIQFTVDIAFAETGPVLLRRQKLSVLLDHPNSSTF
jgi:hypothetical protein